jgi:hypothetical protein
MNEDLRKVKIGSKGEVAKTPYQSYWIKPAGKFWKRFFNKKVRKGAEYKRGNWFHWS